MADLATYVRIYDPSPEDDAVIKREAAVKDAVTQLRKTNDVSTLVRLGAATAQAFAEGIVPDPLGSVVAAAIKKQAPAYVRNERELETAVISAVAIMELLEGPDTGTSVSTKDVVGAALWSALSYQTPVEEPKLEHLRQNLLTLASDRSVMRAESSRKRTVPKDIPAAAEDDVAQIGKSMTAATAAVAALRDNAALDREEIDVLWWALGGRSPTIERSYEDISPAVRGVVRGVELGILLRRLPSRSLRSLALSRVPDVEPLTLSALIGQLKDVIKPLSSKIPAHAVIEENTAVFPLLTAILTGRAQKGGSTKSGDEWCGRAVLEAGLASLCENPVPRI